MILVLIVVPAQDVNKRQRANEASAVARLRLLCSMEKEYAQGHLSEGYVCDLAELAAKVPPTQDYLSAFFSTGTISGYRSVISGCETASGGAVTHYRVIAIPIEPGKSVWRTFCTDETGVLRYTFDASSESCFSSHEIID